MKMKRNRFAEKPKSLTILIQSMVLYIDEVAHTSKLRYSYDEMTNGTVLH